jgi:hypothetical protein
MIAPLPPTPQKPIVNIASTAQSKDGQTLFQQWREHDESTQRSWILSENKRELFEELRDILSEGYRDDWDGFDAIEVMRRTAQTAAEFIIAFPPNLCKPELGISPQGDISFDWAQSASRVVSVAISHDRKISYGWVNRSQHGHGGYAFTGVFDPELFQRIQDVLG